MTGIPAPGIYPVIDRLPEEDKQNPRILELFIAFNKTVKDHCDPLLERLVNLQSYWTANESDLKYILKRDFGDYFGDITETEEEKRVYLWQIYETPFYKHSLNIINHELAKLNLVAGCVKVHQYYWNPADPYSPSNYVTAEYVAANSLDIEDFVALSEITLQFDEYNLSLTGRDAEVVKSAIHTILKRTMGYHIQMSYTIIESAVSSVRSLALGGSKQVYQTITMN